MEIISTTNVETQEQLLDALREAGFNSTQATISRDIKELRIIKELTSFGTYHYTAASRDRRRPPQYHFPGGLYQL